MPHVHINGHTVKGWLIALACGIAGYRAAARLLTIHSGMTPTFLAGGGQRKLLARLACSPYQRIICVSHEIRRALEATGVASELLAVLPAYLADPRKPIPLSDIFKHWLQSHSPLLSTALSFRPEYGFDVLLAALLELRRNQSAIGLVVIGGGEDFEAAKEQIAERGLEDSILLLGEVPHELCLSLMASSDGFVRATRADGDSIAVREALALGIPVVASDVCHRPSGTVLFRNGDAADLAVAIENCLCRESRVGPECQGEGGRQRLIEMYADAVQGRKPAVMRKPRIA
jgi:glycosyltransferase involved in cell wall biosynthesis